MKGFGSGKPKKGWLLGGIAILLAAVVAVCFCCVRIETPQQRQQRLASEAGITSSWSTASAEAQAEPVPAGSEVEAEAQEESASSASAAGETLSWAEASSGQAETSGATQTSQSAGTGTSVTASEPPAVSEADSQPETPLSNTVTVSISCQTALDYPGDLGLSLPEDGMLLPATQWEFTGSATVWDAFQAVCNANGIEYRTTSSWSGEYIRQIAGLREFDCGSTSGWVYYLNGNFSSQGISNQLIRDGDMIQIAYTVIPGDSVPS